MLYRHDTKMLGALFNIKYHMDKEYDHFMVIVGGTGDGKSRFVLNLFETWYRIVLKQKVTEDMISQVSQGYLPWLKQFETIKAFDMNVFDESSRDLNSADAMTKISKGVNKLFDVCRCEKFFSVLVLPNFFRLNKALREDRIRCLVYINKRGQYKLYTKEDLKYLNGYNMNRRIKSMAVARPSFIGKFPDYDGVLLKPYLKQKREGVREVISEVISDAQKSKKNGGSDLASLYKDKVNILKFSENKSVREIAKELCISPATVHRTIQKIRVETEG